MSPHACKYVQRANAAFLLIAGGAGFVSDLRGAFLGQGPMGQVVRLAPDAAIGFVEAHGLAFILGLLLATQAPARLWHLTAAGIHLLLGASNIVFWNLFVATDMLWMGIVTTSLHAAFFVLQSLAASGPSPRMARA
jgi:hypothetical protein